MDVSYSPELQVKINSIEPRLVKKLDAMILRCRHPKVRQDALLLNEARTGDGKTNASLVEGAYIRQKIKRVIHLFFNLGPLIDFVKSTKNKLIIWDEPSLDALSTDQMKELNKNFKRLLNTMRKKRHFFIINLTRFYEYPQKLTTDRANGMIHLYSRKGLFPGYYVYIREKNLESLWRGYSSKKQRMYRQYKSFHGHMPEIMDNYFEELDITIHGDDKIVKHATQEVYEDMKDDAVSMIGEHSISKDKQELVKLRCLIGTMPSTFKTRLELAKHFGVSVRTVQSWRERAKTEGFTRKNEVLEVAPDPSMSINGTNVRETENFTLHKPRFSSNNPEMLESF